MRFLLFGKSKKNQKRLGEYICERMYRQGKGGYMNTSKRMQYANELNSNGIDTFSAYVHGQAERVGDETKRNIKSCSYQPDKEKTYIEVNPNKQKNGGEKLITKYSDLKEKVKQILKELSKSPEDLDMIRADFCFNSKNEESYHEYKKLHRLLISCLAKAYKFKNCYQSKDLWTHESLSIAIKKSDSEIENYNKKKESNGKDENCNRLEIRSKLMRGSTLEYQFLLKWFERLDKAKGMYKEVQQESNRQLEKLYKEDLKKKKRDRDYLSLNAFLMQYRECIYCRRQMIDLLSRFEEVEAPEKKADKFKEKHKIEYFSQRDIDFLVDVLKKKLIEYFES